MKSGVQIRPLIDRSCIRARVWELARRISTDYATRMPLLIGVLDGARAFLEELRELLSIPVDCAFLHIATYGGERHSSGSVRLLEDVPLSPKGRQVLVIEDIVDTGLTLEYVRRHLLDLGASEVRTCVLLDKAAHRKVNVRLDYVGFKVPDVFVVGYGLDWAGRYRELPYVGALEESRPATEG